MITDKRNIFFIVFYPDKPVEKGQTLLLIINDTNDIYFFNYH